MKDVAFYYPGHIWYNTDRLKPMLLFFDSVGLLIPEYKLGEPEENDPVLAGPLRDQGLLEYFIADNVIDADSTTALADALVELIDNGAFDALARDGTAFHELSMSRLGYAGNAEVAQLLFEKLKGKELARDSEDGSSIPMHPMVRYLVLILLAQILRTPSIEKGLNISPITDRPQIARALSEFLSLPSSPSAGRVVEFDLQTISPDLRAVPLDEVLDFRRQNLDQYQRYMRNLRKFARELSQIPEADQELVFRDRQAEIDEHASELKRLSRTAWRKPATIGLGLAGAAWVTTGDPISALIAVGGIALTELGEKTEKIDAFSYLMAIQDRF